MARLEGKVAIVTGGAQGLGAAITKAFLSEGCKVLFTDILEEEGRKLIESLDGKAEFIHHDVADSEGWPVVVARAESLYGSVTTLVNNAAIVYRKVITELTDADYRRVIDVNQVGTFLGMRAVVPSMRRAGGGSIINIGSTGSMNGIPSIPYSASKFAVRGMTKSAALELATINIRVNMVIPGPFDTALMPKQIFSKDTVPMGRIGNPSEFPGMVIFLASDEASFCTGGEYTVDGGFTAKFVPYPADLFSDLQKL
jgi:3alpha(or 20beta)-hydroxysteroid dehydrogenase